jgi:hypothetical protein
MNKSVMFKYVWQVVRRYFAGKLMRLCIIALTIFGGHIIPAAAAPLIQKIGAPLSHPWGMDFLDERHLFVTERRRQSISCRSVHRHKKQHWQFTSDCRSTTRWLA